MADQTSKPRHAQSTPADRSSDDLTALIEQIFFAYRAFTAEPDAILAPHELGRAHHRVLHFVARHPGIRVSGLLEILDIKKQSLARVLGDLVRDGWLEAQPGREDRRERNLTLTSQGADLAQRLVTVQQARVARALAVARASVDHSDVADRAIAAFLDAMHQDEDT